MIDSRGDVDDGAAGAPASESQVWTPDRIASERRRFDRQLLFVLAVLAVGFFGLLRYEYPTVRASSGTTYEIVGQGRHWGTDWRGSYVHFLAHASEPSGIKRELDEIAPFVESFAVQNGDSLLEVVAKHRVFRFGLFTIDQSYYFRFHRERGEWIRD